MAAHRDLRLLAYFVEIVRAGSIRGAASKLSLSPTVLSDALSDLEAMVGVTLITRTTRSMSITDAGKRVLERAAIMTSAADEALTVGSEIAHTPKGRVRVTVPAELCLAWLPNLLRSFERSHPDVQVHVRAEDNPIDLASSNFDVAVRATFSETPDTTEESAASIPLAFVCVPDFESLTRLSLKQSVQTIGFVGSPDQGREHRSIFAMPRRRRASSSNVRVDAPCRFAVDNHVLAHRLALDGFGAALLMHLTVDDDLATGRLIPVSSKHHFGFAVVRILARDRFPNAATGALMHHLNDSCSSSN